jgi:hypothetical protein
LFFYKLFAEKNTFGGQSARAALMAMTLVVLWFFQAGVDKVSSLFFVLLTFLSGFSVK